MSTPPLDPADRPVDPSDPYQRIAQTFPRLTEEQLTRLVRFATVEAVPAGRVLFERGDRGVDFFVVLEGAIEIYEHGPDGPRVVHVHGENQFTGELDLFNNRQILVGGRMSHTGRVARVRRAQFRRLMAAEPDIGELILRAFILRRVGLIEHEQGGALLIGARRSADTLRIQRFMDRNGYPMHWLDSDADPTAAAETLARHGVGAADTPVVVLPQVGALRNPTTAALAEALGLIEPLDADEVFDLAVVGAGPAGLAAAVYGASEGLSTIVLEAEAPGGQAGTSSKIENYLGFPTGISGGALAGRAQVQAQKFGARLAVPARAMRLDCGQSPYAIELDDGRRVRTRTVVIATGARYRSLDVADIERFEGTGVHYACTAVESALCEGEEVVVVGGGNSAGQAAVYLSRHAARVHILVRGPGLAASMSKYLISRIDAADHVDLHSDTEIIRLEGERYLERVTWRNRRSGAEETRPIAAVFLMLGAVPNTEWLRGCVDLDGDGFVRCGVGSEGGGAWAQPRSSAFETNRAGIFAVGDVRAGSIKRVASAVGEGSIVVPAIHRILAGG